MDAALKRSAAIGVVIAACLGMLWPASGSAAAVQPEPASERRYGVVVGLPQSETETALDDLGVSWVQVTFDWALFQPEAPADFETDSVPPEWVTASFEAGREVVGHIVGAPGWATDSGQTAGVPRGLAQSSDSTDNVWAAYVWRLVSTYAPVGIHRWIIYDEPDVALGEGRVRWAGDVEDYARLVQVAYEAAARADPAARIHLAAADWWADVAAGREPYLARLLRTLESIPGAAIHGYYFDVVTLRVTTGTDAARQMVGAARAILAAAGLEDNTIWLEAGVNVAPGALLAATHDSQADFVVQVAAASWVWGVERLAIYRLRDDTAEGDYGLTGADVRRPAFDAYRSVISLLRPTWRAVEYSHLAATLIILEQPERVLYVMWARRPLPVRYQISSPVISEQAELHPTRGEPYIVKSQAVAWPGAYSISLEPAMMDANGFYTVEGRPTILALPPTTEFFRVVYLTVDGAVVRVR